MLARLSLLALHPKLDGRIEYGDALTRVDPSEYAAPKLTACAARVAASAECGHIIFCEPTAVKSRGCCPSCMGRRMAEGAALLVDHVLPAVGWRCWPRLRRDHRRHPGRRPGPGPCAGRLRAARARRPAPGTAARAGGEACADRVGLRHPPPRRDHCRRPRPQAARASLPILIAPALRMTPSRRSPTAACASTSRLPGAAALPMPT